MIFEPLPVLEEEALVDIYDVNLHDPDQEEQIKVFLDRIRDTVTLDQIKYFCGRDVLPTEFIGYIDSSMRKMERMTYGSICGLSVEENLVGICLVGSNPQGYTISTLVLPDFHSLGIGSALKMYVLNRYVGKGSDLSVRSIVMFENIASIKASKKVHQLVKSRYSLEMKGGGKKDSVVNVIFRNLE